MSNEDRKSGVAVDKQQHNQYGTFQGVANYPPPRPPRPHHHNPHPQQQQHQHQQQHHVPTIGFPPPPSIAPPQYYPQAYQTVPGTPVREKLPCCGIGFGWFLFIIGFFIGGLPWYIGFFVLLCARIDDREKAGYIACTIAALLATITIILSATIKAGGW